MSVEEIQLLFEYYEANNGLLVRLIEDIEFLIALLITGVISYFYYSFLKCFTRF